MIPILDMCNHDEHGKFCTDFDDERKCAKCYALRDLNENDEIKIFYGNRNNCDLLIHNGFVIENNQFNTFKLKLGISVHDKLFKERTLALEKFGISNTESFEIFSKSQKDSPIPDEAFYFVKVFTAKIDELEELLKMKCDSLTEYFKVNNLKQDENVKTFLRMRLNILLKSYEKTQVPDLNEQKNSNCLNDLFIKRLIHSEQSLINETLDLI